MSAHKTRLEELSQQLARAEGELSRLRQQHLAGSTEDKERVQVEDALRQSEARYRMLFETMTEGFCLNEIIFDESGLPCDLRYLAVNPAFELQTGIKAADILGRTARQLFPEVDPVWLERYREVIHGGEAVRFEEWFGPLQRCFSVSAFRTEPGRFAAVFSDVTDRKRAEESLRKSEEALRQLNEELERKVLQRTAELESANVELRLEIAERKQAESRLAMAQQLAEQHAAEMEATYRTAPVGLAVLDRELRYVRINERLAEMNGVPVADHIGRTVQEVVPAVEEQVLTALHRILETREPLLNVEVKGQTLAQPGVDRVWSVNSYPLRDSVGEISGINVTVEEITARKRAESSLAEAAERVAAERKRFNDVLETLPAYLILLTPDYHVKFANRFFRDRFGDANGESCYEFLFHRTEPCDGCETPTVVKTGKPHRWNWIGPDGSVYDIFGFPFTDVDGSPLIMEMGVDITEQRRAETELKTAHQELTARAAQLRALASELTLAEQRERRRMAQVLHDHLQQLLVAAKFRTAILGRTADELVKHAAKEIEDLIDDSINVSRSLTAELSPPVLYEGGLNPGFEWLARWMADRHGLSVDLTMDKIVPPIGEDVKILLFESVRELLFNAVKHSQARSATVSMRIQDAQLQIRVSDMGIGFTPESIKSLSHPGSGFGLFSIRERLDLFGGKMHIESAPGKGSRFVLTLPLVQLPSIPIGQVALDSEMPINPPIAQAASLPAGPKIRVMLADDHAVMREGLTGLLNAEPDIETVGEAANGQEVVELARRLLPDVILMDWSMPGITGVELTRIIHNELANIQIIGLSMFDEPERAKAMLDAGAVDYLSKSGPSVRLIAAIRRCRRKPRRRSLPNAEGWLKAEPQGRNEHST